jgi:hypothetical protein
VPVLVQVVQVLVQVVQVQAQLVQQVQLMHVLVAWCNCSWVVQAYMIGRSIQLLQQCEEIHLLRHKTGCERLSSKEQLLT